MKRTNKFLILFATIALLALPALTYAQGRGQGRGRGSNYDKKCAKFVNCHDARDGRWDGRGPNRTNSGSIYDDIFRNRRIYRDRDIYDRDGRNRRVDRDGDGDFDRDDVRLGRQRRVDRDGDGDFDRDDVRLGRRDRERWERRDRRYSPWNP